MTNNLQELLEYVRDLRAIDFSAYRPNTITRRLELRLSATGMPDYPSYHKYIMKNPAEIDALIDALTIKVSCFFRKPLVFEILLEDVLPELLDTFKNDVLRIWCVGCARGEEAYSIAILINEITKKEADCPRVFVLGTDIDKDALEEAKNAVYGPDSLLNVRKDYLDRYFVYQNGLYFLKDEIRAMVTFAYHNVITSASPKEGIFSDYHLVLCRNVLIYFSRELVENVLNNLSGHIIKNGYLVLGEAESLLMQLTNEHEEIIKGSKIFRRLL